MKSPIKQLILATLVLGAQSPTAHAFTQADESEKLAHAQEALAKARLDNAQADLVEAQARIQQLLGDATQSEVSVFQQQALFAKSLLIQLRNLESTFQSQSRQFQALSVKLSELNDGKMLGAQISFDLFHDLGVRPSDFMAYAQARDHLLGALEAGNFVCNVNPCRTQPAGYTGGTVDGLIRYLSSNRLDLNPVNAPGVQALEAIDAFVNMMALSAEQKRLQVNTEVNQRIDLLEQNIKSLTVFSGQH